MSAGSKLHAVRAVVFDFDGVILESARIKARAFVELFADYPEHHAAILDHHKANLGVSRFDKFAWIYANLLGRPLGEDERLELGGRYSALVYEHMLECPFVPGAREALEDLQDRCHLLVASGTPQAELEAIVQARGLWDRFTAVFGTPRTKLQILRQILQAFALEPLEVVMLGDGASDWQAATRAGVQFIARATDYQPVDWAAHGVTSIPDLRQLPTLIVPAADGRAPLEERQPGTCA